MAAALTQYIYWRGRYVIPRESDIEDLVPTKQDDGLVRPKHHTATIESARALIDHLVNEVKTHLYGLL